MPFNFNFFIDWRGAKLGPSILGPRGPVPLRIPINLSISGSRGTVTLEIL